MPQLLKISRLLSSILFLFLVGAIGVSCNETVSKKEETNENQSNGDRYPIALDLDAFPHLRNLVLGPDKIKSERDDILKITSFEDLPKACVDSGGVWKQHLLACHCERNKLFSPRFGCAGIEVTREGIASLIEGMEKILNEQGEEIFSSKLQNIFPKQAYLGFHERWEQASFADKLKLAKLLDQSGFDFLLGENDYKYARVSSFNGKDKDLFLLEIVPYIDPAYDIAPAYHQHAPQLASYTFERAVLPFHDRSVLDFERCSSLFQDAEDLNQVCDELFSKIECIKNESCHLDFVAVGDINKLSFSGFNEWDRASDGSSSYLLLARQLNPIQRMLMFERGEYFIKIFLSPAGKVERAKLTKSDFLVDGGDYLESSKELSFDNFFQPKVEEKLKIPLESLWIYLDQRSTLAKLKHKNFDQLRVHFEDKDLNLNSDVGNFIYLNNTHLADLPSVYDRSTFTNYLLNHPVFDDLGAVINVRDKRSFSHFVKINPRHNNGLSHADDLFPLIIKDLSDEQVQINVGYQLIRENIGLNRNPTEYLQSSDIKVAVIASTNYILDESYYKKMFMENPDVVFIFASGNRESEDFVHDPIWSVSRQDYLNVLVAATYNPLSSKKISGLGGRYATVAVPQNHDLGGTSSSSAQLGNLVIKLRLKFPDMNGEQIVDLVHKNLYIINDLPVKTHGVVDLNLSHYSVVE